MLHFRCQKCKQPIFGQDLVCSKCGHQNELSTVNQTEFYKAQNQVIEVASSVRKLRLPLYLILCFAEIILFIATIFLFMEAKDASTVREYYSNSYSYGWKEYTDINLLRANTSTVLILFCIDFALVEIVRYIYRIFLPLSAYKKMSTLNINMPYFVYIIENKIIKVSGNDRPFILSAIRVFYEENKSNAKSYFISQVSKLILVFMLLFLVVYNMVNIIFDYIIYDSFIISSPIPLILLGVAIIGLIIHSILTKNLTWKNNESKNSYEGIISKEDLERVKTLNPTEKDFRKSI